MRNQPSGVRHLPGRFGQTARRLTGTRTTGNAFERLAEVFVRILKVSRTDVQVELSPEDVVGWDSLGHVQLMAAVEEEFDVMFDLKAVMRFSNFGAILDAVKEASAEK